MFIVVKYLLTGLDHLMSHVLDLCDSLEKKQTIMCHRITACSTYRVTCKLHIQLPRFYITMSLREISSILRWDKYGMHTLHISCGPSRGRAEGRCHSVTVPSHFKIDSLIGCQLGSSGIHWLLTERHLFKPVQFCFSPGSGRILPIPGMFNTHKDSSLGSYLCWVRKVFSAWR